MSRDQVLSDLHQIPGLTPYLKFSTDNQTPIDDRLFAHIHLSQEMAGLPRYQGHQPEVTTKYAAQIMRNFTESSAHQGIWFESLKQAARDLEIASEEKEALYLHRNSPLELLAHIAQRFKKKSRILLPLVWTSDYQTRQGHGVLVEFEKINDHLYAIRVMNAGEGLEKHAPANIGTSNTVKEYRYTKEQFGTVIEKLSPALSALTADKFYDALSVNEAPAYSPAESSKTMLTGMCTWKMIIALLKNRLHNHTAYLRIKQEIEMQSLVDYLLLFSAEPTADRANHLELAMNNYARFLSEKVKDLDQISVQNSLQLCQYIETTLRKKNWLRPTAVNRARLITPLPVQLTLSETTPDSTLNIQQPYPYQCASDLQSSRIGSRPKPNEQDVSTIRDLIALIDEKIDSQNPERQKSAHWKRYLDESVLRFPNIEVVYAKDQASKQEKERWLKKYADTIRQLQTTYAEKHAKIDEPYKTKTSPEYVLCSAKLFLEMLKTAHLYFGDTPPLMLPKTILGKIQHYQSILNSIGFYQMTQEMSDIRNRCLIELNTYATRFNYQDDPLDAKKSYYQLVRYFLEHRHNMNEAQLLEAGNRFLQQFTADPNRPLSKHNPAKLVEVVNALGNVKTYATQPRIQNGAPFHDARKLATIENPLDLIIDNLATLIPLFSDDGLFIDAIWDFFHAMNGYELFSPIDSTNTIDRDYVYDYFRGIMAISQHELVPNYSKEPLVNYCIRHQKVTTQCINCVLERMYNTNAYDYSYTSGLSLRLIGTSPLSMGRIWIHHERVALTEAVIATEDVNEDICAQLNARKGGDFSNLLERQVAISSAFGICETHIENILQYYEKNFSLLTGNLPEREKLCMVLLRADALKILSEKNPHIAELLRDFFTDYQAHFNLQSLKTPGSVNFLHFLAIFCYHQSPPQLKPILEAQYRLSQTNPFGKLTDLFYRLQTDITGSEAECLVSYYSALHAYSQTPQQRTMAEERMLSQLQYQIVNLYNRFITENKQATAHKQSLITEIQKWISSVPKYQQTKVLNAAPEHNTQTTCSNTFFVIAGQNQSLRLNLATGDLEDGSPAEVDVPVNIRALFSAELNGIKKARLINARYYFTHQKSEYCITWENSTWVIYRKIGAHWFKKIEYANLKEIILMPNQLRATVSSGARQPKYDFWCRVDAQTNEKNLYVIDRETDQQVYQYHQKADDRKFFKHFPKGWEPMTFFCTEFESMYLTEAFDQSVTLPRYNLEFKQIDGQHVWTKNEQFILADFHPLELGESFTQFLGLVSKDGQKRKVLIPCQSYIYNFDNNKVTLDTYGLVDTENALHAAAPGASSAIQGNNTFHKPGSARYIECDVDEQGQLSTKKLSDKVYLMYLFLGQSNYTRAFEVFQEIELSGYYSVDAPLKAHLTKILLENIPFKTKACDPSIDATRNGTYSDSVLQNGKRAAIQLKMLVNLLTTTLCNQSLQAEQLLQQTSRTIPALLKEYNQGYANTPAEMRLSDRERMTLLNFMTSNGIRVDTYLTQKSFSDKDSRPLTDGPRSAIPWKQDDMPDDATRFVSATLFQTDTFGIDTFAETTETLLENEAVKQAGGTLLDDMQLDDACGTILRKRASELNKQCVRILTDLRKSALEANILEQFDHDIKKTQGDLFGLAFKNHTSQGKITVGHVAKVLGRRRSKTNFRTLVQLFIQNNPEAYRHQLGELTDEEIHGITVSTAKLLLLLTSRKYYARLIPELENAKKVGNSEKIGEILQERRAYQLDDPNARYYLAYEYLSGILIRPSQMKMLMPLLEHKDDSEKHKNYVFQLIMGGGKSKVLMPVSAFLKANGQNLVTVVVPDSLFETNLNDLSRYSQVNFNQKAVPLRFKRADASDIEKLENIRDRLKEVIINKDYIVTTKTTFQSIELSYLSLLASDSRNTETPESIKLLEEILTIIQEQSDVFIDEIDTNLSCFDELNYTLNYLHYPPEYLVSLQVNFFEFLCKDQDGPNSSFYDQLMTPNLTLNKPQFNRLLSGIVKRMAVDRDSILYTALEGLDESIQKQIITYLSTNSEDAKLPDCFQHCDESKKRIIGFCKAQFSSILPLTLSKEENVNYGFSKQADLAELVDREIAIPYAGNNNPRETSRFASLFETFGYTTVAQLKKGVSKACLETYLATFIEQYESQANDAEKRQLAQILFEELHLNPADYSVQSIIEKNETTLNSIWERVKNNRSVILLMLQKLILNKIKLYPFMLSSNSSDFTNMLNIVQGASGTIDNPGILDPSITFKKSLSLGTDGKTIAILREKAYDELLNVNTKNATAYLEELSAQRPDFAQYQAIIDIGSHFTGVSNQTVAEQIAAFYTAFYTAHPNPNQYKYVLYFNQDNILCALPIHGGERIELGSSDADVIKSKLGCGPSEYFAYFDQIHTVGTDLPLAKASIGGDLLPAKTSGAKAFVSFSPTTTQQALLQGVMRARDLATSQNVAFVANPSLRSYLDSKNLRHDKDAILKIARENLIEQIHEGAFRAANQKIKAIYRRALLDKVRKAETLEEKQALLHDAEGLVFSKTELDPGKLFLGDHTIENTQIILEKLAKSFEEKSHFYVNSCSSEESKIKQNVEAVIKHCMRYCREKTAHTSYPAAQAEVELQAEAELAQEAEVKAEAEKRNELQLARLDAAIKYTPRAHTVLPDLITLSERFAEKHTEDLLSLTSELTDLAADTRQFDIAPDSIFASPNLLASNQSQRFLSQPAVKTCYHVLCMENKKTSERNLILLSEQDAEIYRQALNDPTVHDRSAYNFSVKTMSGHTTCGHTSITEDFDWQCRMEQARFLTGYIAENNAWLWQGAIREKLNFYRKFILPYHPSTEGTLLFLEKKLSKERKQKNILAAPPKETDIIPPWKKTRVAVRKAMVEQHEKFFLKPEEVPSEDRVRTGYVKGTYQEISLRSVMHRCLSYPVIGFFVGCAAALVLNIKAYSLKCQIKKEGLVVTNVAYQSIEALHSLPPPPFQFLSGESVYKRALTFYKNTKAQLEQAQADVLRQREPTNACSTYQPNTLAQVLDEAPVPLVWGESALVDSNRGSRGASPTSLGMPTLTC